MSGSILVAASVGATERLFLTKSECPSSSSSRRTCWLTAPGVTFNSSAARLKLARRATASKARKALRGGSDFDMTCY
jgi:hypothetical protein